MSATPSFALADEVYQQPKEFLAEVFAGKVPSPKLLWITAPLRTEINALLGHRFGALRVRFWGRGGRTAWILEEIGKYKPITAGLVVNDGRIERLKVLIYRESHGWEVRYPFFTRQFSGLSLRDNLMLTKNIDGISGATLSVNALTRLSRLALYLHRQTDYSHD